MANVVDGLCIQTSTRLLLSCARKVEHFTMIFSAYQILARSKCLPSTPGREKICKFVTDLDNLFWQTAFVIQV